VQDTSKIGLDLSWYSHIPVLSAYVARTSGPILEMGSGHGSTPLIHAMCPNREILTADSDSEWLEKFRILESENHKLQLVSDWNEFYKEHEDKLWSVAFVDHSPGEERRYSVEWLSDRAIYIIAHDTEQAPAAAYNYEPAFAKFKYRHDWTMYRPWTTVVSMVRDTSPTSWFNPDLDVWPK